MSDGKGRTNGGVPSLAVARAMLATASGRKKLDVVFNSPDPKGFVRALPAEDLYFAIRDIGLADAVEIVGLASPGQFRSFVDLDAWEKDLPDTPQVLLWLRVAMEAAGSDGDFRSKRRALDVELIILLLKTQTRIHQLEEGDDPDLTSDNWLRTAEGKYLVEILAEGDDGVTMRRLLEDFIAENPFEATRLFEAVRWEMQGELEENCRRWREGRLRDMGFPGFEEAIRIWNPLPKDWVPGEEAPAAGHVAGVPALLLATSRGALFLDRVAEKLPDEDRGPFNEGLVYLLNCAIVADGIDPKDIDLARGSLAAARDQLSLGLELLSDGDESRALAILASTPAVELFRSAVTSLAELQREATVAARRVSFGEGGVVGLESPDSELLSGLRRKRPRLYDPPRTGQPRHPSGDWRALRDRQDLARARLLIARARAAGDLLEALGLTPDACRALAQAAGRASTAITASQLVLTCAVRQALGAGGVAPLEADQVPKVAALFDGGKLTQAARQALEQALGATVDQLPAERRDAARDVAHGWLARLEQELGPPAQAGALDPRFVELVLVAP